ncbi:MAG: IS110 family transposase [Dehalococcoidia bacterium]
MNLKEKKVAVSMDTISLMHANAAGLDIGSEEIWACIPADRDIEPVRKFGTYTPDLHALAHWLKRCRIKTVAMESTGVYWIPVYEILEAEGFRVYLVNARHLKHVPGRKSDVEDCQWVQQLHSYGLLNNSFRPEGEMCVLRAYLRHRAGLIEHRAPHIQHIQKALLQMNVQLTQVLSDITGVTSMAIIREIVAGNHDPVKLAELRDPRCAKPESEIAKALTGNYRAEHLFALKQALALYDVYTQKIAECDEEIERQFSAVKPIHDDDLPPLDTSDKRNTHSKNAPSYDVRTMLYQILGVDLIAIQGLNAGTAETIISEAGTDMSRWPSVKQFCSWLGLAPHNDISGGKVLRSRTLKTRNRAGQAFRLAAQAVGKTQSAFGAFFRQMRSRKGPRQAIVATAHKIARAFYFMLKYRKPFHNVTSQEYDRGQQEREIHRLQKRAAKLGLLLVQEAAA